MKRKKLTVYDYLKCKGKRQLSVLFVHSAEEAKAAEDAGIDMICTSHDAPQFGIYNSFDELKRIREAAPSCFMQSGTATNIASEYEAMKSSHRYLEIGADVIYGGNWSYKIITALRQENVPIKRFSFKHSSWDEMAWEAGMSRIHGGIHIHPANDEGLVAGKIIAELDDVKEMIKQSTFEDFVGEEE